MVDVLGCYTSPRFDNCFWFDTICNSGNSSYQVLKEALSTEDIKRDQQLGCAEQAVENRWIEMIKGEERRAPETWFYVQNRGEN
jgi:hypothetical protein